MKTLLDVFDVFMEKLIGVFRKWLPNIKLTIRSKIVVSFIIVILMMSCLNVILMISSLSYNRQYNTIVSNITEANTINGSFKTRIDSEMYDIISGRIDFHEGKQYTIINQVNDNIQHIMKTVSSPESRSRLDVSLRTLKTLKQYVDKIGAQIDRKAPVTDNEKVLEDVRSVSSLVEEDVQEFELYEIQRCEKVNTEIQKSVSNWVVTNVIVLSLVLLFSAGAAWLISGSISNPIRELHRTTALIAAGNLDVRVKNENIDEIAGLSISFNIMIGKIKELLANSIKEQENLKKAELKALQAQINPHFLYNTLDTIVWMAEANKSEQVIEIVKAFSSFFRITLSKGKEWIPVRDEIAHIRSYLTIQKIRYRDILDFEIRVSDEILDCKILKLTLQPLVENALYHGIKNKRSGGTILINGFLESDNSLLFEVIDNGIGMTEERLSELHEVLENESMEEYIIKESGFGLNNVDKRVKLYYGKQYGIKVQSEYNKGTRVYLCIPIER